MQGIRKIDEYLASPVGRYFEASTFVYWYPYPDINGFSLRGCPDPDDIQQLIRLIEALLPTKQALDARGGVDAPPPVVSLIDARRLVHVDPAAFASLARYLESRWDRLAGVIRRQALVRPVGLAGTVVAGFYEVLRPSFPVRVFEWLDDALDWLGPSAGERARGALRILDGDEERGDALADRLRRLLESSRGKVTVARVARELGVSERTLQRRLHALGTTFQDEVLQARVRTGKAMMLASEANLTAIALEVGCASLQHYSALFRKVTGLSPSVWRKRERATQPSS
jgi:AraC-like DNA-binding protein